MLILRANLQCALLEYVLYGQFLTAKQQYQTSSTSGPMDRVGLKGDPDKILRVKQNIRRLMVNGLHCHYEHPGQLFHV